MENDPASDMLNAGYINYMTDAYTGYSTTLDLRSDVMMLFFPRLSVPRDININYVHVEHKQLINK